MRALDVYLGEKLIGRIIENRKGGRFEYESSIASKLAGRPVLSLAFPAKARPFGEAKTSAWFNGLLPRALVAMKYAEVWAFRLMTGSAF